MHLKKLIKKVNAVSDNHFSRYLVISAGITIFTTAVLWLFVDIFGVLAAIVNPPLSALVFFLKYFLYQRSGMLGKGKKVFLGYVTIWLLILTISTSLLWLTVDLMKLTVIIMNPIILVFTFLLRFYFYKIFKMLKKQEVL